MKMLRFLTLFIFILYGVQSCNNPSSKDTVSIAKKANKGKDTADYVVLQDMGPDDFPATASLPYGDSDFAVDAADRDMLEIELGRISLKNSSNQEIKNFGQMMIDDYTTTNNKLIALAKQKTLVLPPSPSQRSIKHIKDLIDKTGDDFDRHYINFVVSNQRSTISIFENASNNTADVDIKAFATNTLPTLKKHLAAAKLLKDKF